MSSDIMTKQARERIELLLLGWILGSSNREQCLQRIAPGTLTGEYQPIADAMRPGGDSKVVIEWLAKQTAIVEKGKTAVDALIDAIHRDNSRQDVDRILASLGNSKLRDRDKLLEHLKNCVQRLEAAT
jgi:hypothetical protein